MAKGEEGVRNNLSSWLAKFICRHQIQFRKAEKETYKLLYYMLSNCLGPLTQKYLLFSIIICLKICNKRRSLADNLRYWNTDKILSNIASEIFLLVFHCQ